MKPDTRNTETDVTTAMSTKWSTEVLGKGGKPDFAALLKDDFKVILLRGKNVFGDMIYCYLKVTFGDLNRLQEALDSPNTFNISDYGTVIAAGRGEPTDEVQAEVALAYPMIEKPRPLSELKPPASAVKTEKKAWDEY